MIVGNNTKLIVPESAIDVNDMMERMRREGRVVFEDGIAAATVVVCEKMPWTLCGAGEFAWWWKKVEMDRVLCFECACGLLQVLVEHLK
jgi:hypothetical protein